MKNITLILFILLSFHGFSQDFPVRKDTNALIYDFANIFSNTEIIRLEKIQKNILIKKRVKITVVSVKSMDNIDSDTYTYNLAQNWNLNRNERQILIVIKPKYENEKGQIFIATGFSDISEKISDSMTKEIIEKRIIPEFKKKNIAKGMKLGLKELKKNL